MCDENRKHVTDGEPYENLARYYFTEMEYVLNNPISNEVNDRHMRQLQARHVTSSVLFAQRALHTREKARVGLRFIGLCGVIGTVIAPEELRIPVIGTMIAICGIGTYLLNKSCKKIDQFYAPSLRTFEWTETLIPWYRSLQKHEPQLREQIAAYKKEQGQLT